MDAVVYNCLILIAVVTPQPAESTNHLTIETMQRTAELLSLSGVYFIEGSSSSSSFIGDSDNDRLLATLLAPRRRLPVFVEGEQEDDLTWLERIISDPNGPFVLHIGGKEAFRSVFNSIKNEEETAAFLKHYWFLDRNVWEGTLEEER